MKSHQTTVHEALHQKFKTAAKSGSVRYTLQHLSELGMLLVLVEKGEISSQEEALKLGASPTPAALLGRIIAGQPW